MANGGGDGQTGGWKDGRKDGQLEIPSCVLQDIGPLGPLPNKEKKRNRSPKSNMW